MDARRRLTASFDGHVQGVGFRFTTVHIASHHPISGFVRNLPNGSVDLVAEGDEAALLRFLDELRTSHIFRFVRQEHVSWSDARGEFKDFQVRYDV
jgi:acylphosphatase